MITTINVLRFILILLEISAVTALILIGLDIAMYTYKDRENEKTSATVNDLEIKSFVVNIICVTFDESAKTRVLKKKEETAFGGFFEESYERGFDITGELIYRGEHRYPTNDYVALIKKMDELADDQIFDNTEVL